MESHKNVLGGRVGENKGLFKLIKKAIDFGSSTKGPPYEWDLAAA